MKKNLATILLIAMAFMNLTLSVVLVIAVLPAASKTNRAVSKVIQILDLELESAEPTPVLEVEDIEIYTFADKITVNLAQSSGDNTSHYALINVSLSMNKKSPDFEKKQELISSRETIIKEIISEAFGKYTRETVLDNKNAIKDAILASLAEEFESDFIIGVSFGDILVQ